MMIKTDKLKNRSGKKRLTYDYQKGIVVGERVVGKCQPTGFCGKGETNDQIVRGGMEGYERAVGGGATDDYAVDKTFSGDDGLDKAHDYDFFKTDGG